MVELQLETDVDDDEKKIPVGLLVTFVICTMLLVSVHMLALMISTCILPNIEAISNLDSVNLVNESPHERLHWYIEISWVFSTVLGLFLFLIEIGIVCAVKFNSSITDSTAPMWAAYVILIPVMILFVVFAIHFYKILITLKYKVTEGDIKKLESINRSLEVRYRQCNVHVV